MGVGLDRQGLVHRAAELMPMLRERAAETEVQRSLPQDIVDALHASELLLAVVPECFGGMGYDFEVAFDIAAELGRGCGSTAWCYGIWTSHTWLAGMFPEQAQKAYWADSPKTLSSTSFNPARGTVPAVPGGYQVTGQWDFSSGCDAANWVLLVGNGPDGQLFMMLPRSDYAIEDTWFVSGLRGTGSKDIRVDKRLCARISHGVDPRHARGAHPGPQGARHGALPHSATLSVDVYVGFSSVGYGPGRLGYVRGSHPRCGVGKGREETR